MQLRLPMSCSRARARASAVFALVLGAVLQAGAASADTLRCGNKLVTSGDTLYDVQVRCGAPAFATRRTEVRSVSSWGIGAGATRTLEVVIDEWIYDFGPQKLMQHLIFEQGHLITVRSGHRGEKKPE
jgi:Protein of unknown function (DUF2845)